jgi:hypothetical protein
MKKQINHRPTPFHSFTPLLDLDIDLKPISTMVSKTLPSQDQLRHYQPYNNTNLVGTSGNTMYKLASYQFQHHVYIFGTTW